MHLIWSTNNISAATFTGDSTKLITQNKDKSADIHDARSGRHLQHFTRATVLSSPDSNYFAAISSTEVTIYNKYHNPIKTLSTTPGTQIAFSTDSANIYLWNFSVKIYNIAQDKFVPSAPPPAKSPPTDLLVFNTDRRKFIGQNEPVDEQTLRELSHVFGGKWEYTYKLTVSGNQPKFPNPLSPYIMINITPSTLTITRANGQTLTKSGRNFAVSPDLSLLAATDDSGVTEIYELLLFANPPRVEDKDGPQE